jgi:hypothetical protein
MAARLVLTAVAAAGVATLVACSSGNSAGTADSGDNSPAVAISHPPATPFPSNAPTPTSSVGLSASSPPAAAAPSNLPVGKIVRDQLVKAGAADHHLPASDFTGLVPGETYYAYYPKTSTYWAGAGLVPSSSSRDAQVSVQDDGSYLVFIRHAGGIWRAYDVGLSGIAGSSCAVTVPAPVLQIWHWKAGSCRPPN